MSAVFCVKVGRRVVQSVHAYDYPIERQSSGTGNCQFDASGNSSNDLPSELHVERVWAKLDAPIPRYGSVGGDVDPFEVSWLYPVGEHTPPREVGQVKFSGCSIRIPDP